MGAVYSKSEVGAMDNFPPIFLQNFVVVGVVNLNCKD